MRKILLVIISILVGMLIVFDVILLNKNTQLIKLVSENKSELVEKAESLKNQVGNLSDVSFERFNEVEYELKTLQKNIQIYSDQVSQVKNNLSVLNGSYSNVLTELKKKTVDVSKTDNATEKMRTDAFYFYSEKNYNECLLLCNKILVIQSDDITIRRLKVKSLYYRNPLDSSKFNEILSDINIIINAYGNDEELLKIKDNILAEKGVLDEE